jgi:3-methyladenine DNA glycosylase AlkD
MSAIGEAVQEGLFALRDEGYRDFSCSLMPTVEADTVLGVRSPALSKLCRELLRRGDALDFLEELPHRYYEENLVHDRFLESIGEFEALIPALERFLPWVDNWAVCDSLNPKALGRNLPLLTPRLRRWLGSEHCYTVRFSILTLMRYYLEEDVFRPEYLLWVAELEREEYYIRMMQAWFLAEALARQYDAALPLIAGGTLPLWVHNKTIQKAVESRKIPDERKSALKALRRRREKN